MARNFDGIRQFVVEHRLVTVPADARVLVTATPTYLRASTFAAMNAPGPFETQATQASYYITPVDTNWPAAQQQAWLEAFNFYTADVEAIHEAWPGHYVQCPAPERLGRDFCGENFQQLLVHGRLGALLRADGDG